MSDVTVMPDRLLSANKPVAGIDDAAAIAASAFGVAAKVSLLAGERDANFHLVAAGGREYVLKILNSEEDPSASEAQTRALQHIAARYPSLPTPRVCLALDGSDGAEAVLHGSRHIVRLFTYLDGEPLHRTPPSTAQASAIGATLAALDRALSDFRHPGASRELLWDIRHAARLRPLLVHISDAGRRALATAALDRYEVDVTPLIGEFHAQVVHNDFNPHNILVDPDNPDQVTGVVDFGDMVETALANDVAIAAAYQIGGAAPLERASALIAAFHARYPLEPAEVDALFDLVALRLMVSVTIGEWRASLDPANAAYILRNHRRASAALQSLATVSRDEGRRQIRRACRLE